MLTSKSKSMLLCPSTWVWFTEATLEYLARFGRVQDPD